MGTELAELYEDYQDWLAEQGVTKFSLTLNESDETITILDIESAYEVSLFYGEIDPEFYGDDKAVTVEFVIRRVQGGDDLDPYLVELADSCVFSRLRIRLDDDGSRTLLLESSVPESLADPALYHMMVSEALALAETAP